MIGTQFMTVRGTSLFVTLVLTTLVTITALANDGKPVSAPFGEYRVVALRNASDVATTAHPNVGAEWVDQHVSFNEGKLTWLGGQTCKLWSVRKSVSRVIMLEDPNLSDVVIPPVDSTTSSGDKRVNMPVDLLCQDHGERILASFVIVDARVLVTSTANSTVNLILEQPLTEKQVRKFQEQIRDMKFYDGMISGKLDAATLRGVASYAQYRGAAYRFFRTVITENLLDGLHVLDRPDSNNIK